jgi:hypothetical protein
VEAAYAAYSAEAAQRVSSLQHKVQTLQSAVDTQSALGAPCLLPSGSRFITRADPCPLAGTCTGAVARQAAAEASSAVSGQQERDAIIAHLQNSLATSAARIATLEASVAAQKPVQAACEAQLQEEKQQRAVEKEALQAQLADSRRALGREQERCLQLEEALVKSKLARGGGEVSDAVAPAPATAGVTAEALSPMVPRPGGAIHMLRSSYTASAPPGEVTSTAAAPAAPTTAPSSEEPTPQPTPAATPAPTPVTSRASSPTPRDGGSSAAAQAESMSTLSSVLSSLAFGMSSSSGTAPASGESPAAAAGVTPEKEARTSSGSLLDSLWEAAGLSPKVGQEGSPAGGADGVVAKLRTSC